MSPLDGWTPKNWASTETPPNHPNCHAVPKPCPHIFWSWLKKHKWIWIDMNGSMAIWVYIGICIHVCDHISFRRPVSLIHSGGTWKDMKTKWKEIDATWKENECKMKGTWEEMNGTWTAVKGDESNRWHSLILDQGCFHSHRKLENSHFLSTGSSPPENDKSTKKTIAWFWGY